MRYSTKQQEGPLCPLSRVIDRANTDSSSYDVTCVVSPNDTHTTDPPYDKTCGHVRKKGGKYKAQPYNNPTTSEKDSLFWENTKPSP